LEVRVGTSQDAAGLATRQDLWFSGRSAGDPPGRRLFETGLPAVNFTCIVGALDDLVVIVQGWGSMASPLLESLEAPHILLHPNEEFEPRGIGNEPRVAVLEHAAGLAPTVAQELRAVVPPRVSVDPGYWLTPATWPAPTSGAPKQDPLWTTRWNERWRATLQRFPPPPVPPTVAGGRAFGGRRGPGRVLLVDTGDQRAQEQNAFVEGRVYVEDVPPRDWHGHGTSLGDLIRLRAPKATVHALRVFTSQDVYSASKALLNALTYAVHPVSEVDIVCVAQRALVTDEDRSHAATIALILGRGGARGAAMPIVVCAAGNVPRDRQRAPMELPATAPGVLVARGIGWDGRPLDYNCHPPRSMVVQMVDAYGGEKGDEIGVTEARDQKRVLMVGSSYAAALVAGALAAG
jgi:Subtilase family